MGKLSGKPVTPLYLKSSMASSTDFAGKATRQELKHEVSSYISSHLCSNPVLERNRLGRFSLVMVKDFDEAVPHDRVRTVHGQLSLAVIGK